MASYFPQDPCRFRPISLFEITKFIYIFGSASSSRSDDLPELDDSTLFVFLSNVVV